MNKKFKRRLKEINAEVRVFKKDNQLHTPVALMMTFLGAFIIFVVGYWFLKIGNLHGDFVWTFPCSLYCSGFYLDGVFIFLNLIV
ncbi:MAG TPA: hypothetical protein ACHBX0_04425 [Arsenophonus sp.]